MNMPRKKQKNSKPNSNSGLHPRNQHQGRYDIKALIKALPALESHVILNPVGEMTINFSDPDSVVMLNKALLAHHYGILFWDIPKGYLCPPIPGRADYVHRLAEFIDTTDSQISVLDIGTGASVIYPIIGVTEYQWHFTTSDVDPVSVKVASQIAEQNSKLNK
jgi:23S rRNA (adenine1618-N6)-methyltransferase